MPLSVAVVAQIVTFALLIVPAACGQAAASRPAAAPIPPLPSHRHTEWHKLEFYAFVHFGVNTFTDREWGDGSESPTQFNPAQLDCRQWARVCRDAGMQGIILTAKHHDGFCLWPSKRTEHCVRHSPWKSGQGDVLRELADACREFGLKLGVYVSPWDRNSRHYGDAEAYNEYFRGQLREVLSGYGEVFEVWFDGACGEGPNAKKQVYDWASYVATVRELQPGAVIFSDVGPDVRWVGNEQGFAGETCWSFLDTRGHGRGNDNPPPTRSLSEGDRDASEWIPAECDVSIRPGWFYHAAEDSKVKSVDQLEEIYFKSVGRNASLLLNIPIDRRGLIHEADAASLRGLRRRLDRMYASDLARTAVARSTPEDKNAEWTASRAVAPNSESVRSARHINDGDDSTYWFEDPAEWDRLTATGVSQPTKRRASVELAWLSPQEFDVIELREPIALGQRIEAFQIEAIVDGGAESQWSLIAHGTTIGNRRLLRIEPIKTGKLRLTILKSRSTPAISSIGLFRRPPAE